MLLRDYLVRVGDDYDQAAGFETEPQRLLRDAKRELASYVPPDFLVKASGGQFPLKTTETPWIGFFDPEESTKPQQGLYVVWLLASGGTAWTLSINMGTENRAKRLKVEEGVGAPVRGRESRLLAQITAEAAVIREAMDAEARAGWDASIDLTSDGVRQKRYEAATVLARTYRLDSLPDDATLRTDLAQLCRLLGDAARARRAIAATNPDAISTSSAPPLRVIGVSTYSSRARTAQGRSGRHASRSSALPGTRAVWGDTATGSCPEGSAPRPTFIHGTSSSRGRRSGSVNTRWSMELM